MSFSCHRQHGPADVKSKTGIPLETSIEDLKSYFSPRVIGGENTPEGYAPHMVAILVGDEVIRLILCGGSLVKSNLVMTAAHCLTDFHVAGGLTHLFHAVVGSNNWNTGGIRVEFQNYHMHPEWDPVLIKNDIGFLCLTKKVELSKHLQLAVLNFDFVGVEASSVTGWGWVAQWALMPFHLQVLEVTTLSPEDCVERVLEASSIWWPNAPHVDPTIEICTLHSTGRGLCFGDSGSALMSKETGTQIGIASWAFTCARGVPDMYARISGFKDYIQSIMELY
ncbi:chymotrypsin-2-like [Spodoptera litura]|uniref:Chymotrypsin-2-like n=1 Tax=Spodoptera litura TaxID=69820 RepID=A0A9J7ITW6_SPOLT|nr:chymotrypsin-2-like [Spodoptera litura]